MARGTRRLPGEPHTRRSSGGSGDSGPATNPAGSGSAGASSRSGPARDAATQHAERGRSASALIAVNVAQSARKIAHSAINPSDSDSRALTQALASLGISADPTTQQTLLDYLAMLAKWNTTYNLTAIRDPAAMLVQHLFDCLAIVPALRAQRLLDDGAQVLDVGSGGGLPGVVLAAIAPGVSVHCVDAVGKKAAFVAQVRAELGLANLHAHHARIESLRVPRDLAAATLIVSRAYATLEKFTSQSAHLLAPGGAWAAMKGQYPDDEVEQLPAGVELAATIKLAVPMLDAQRHLLVLRARA